MSKILCFMDFEYTTSGSKKVDFKEDKIELLSVGAVFVDSETKEEIEHFYEIVKPKKNSILSEYCSELTRITQEEVDSARCMKDVVDDFVKVTNKYENIDFFIWGNFDYIALKKSIKITGYKGNFKKIVTTLRNIQPRVSKSIKYKQEILNTEWGLQKVRIIYGMDESENKHNALSDARDLKEVYYAFREKAPKNKVFLKEIYDRKTLERNRLIEKGLEKHDKQINQLWGKLKKSNIHRIKKIDKSEFKKLVTNIPIEYKGIESIAYHDKTISVLKVKGTKSNTIGTRIKGAPVANSVQYRYSDLQVEVYPKVKKDLDTKKEIPVIDVKVYADEKKIYSMLIEVNKSTRKTVTAFIKKTFLNDYVK